MEEKLFFYDSRGNRLCGILSNPANDKLKSIIILCHGFSSNKESKTYTTLQKALNQKNVSTFRFDFYGHGESEGKFEDTTISLAVDAVLQAVKFLKEENYSKIGLVGGSFGGMASLIVASQSEDLFILALKAPVSDYLGKLVAQKSQQEIKDWEEKGFIYYLSGKQGKLKLNYSFFEDAKKYENYYRSYKKIKIPVLIVHGDEDTTVPLKQSRKTCSVIPDCRLEVIEGADHFFKEPAQFERVINLIVSFIEEKSK